MYKWPSRIHSTSNTGVSMSSVKRCDSSWKRQSWESSCSEVLSIHAPFCAAVEVCKFSGVCSKCRDGNYKSPECIHSCLRDPMVWISR
eukprot:6432756-Pyramimonas_sp.AAC.1